MGEIQSDFINTMAIDGCEIQSDLPHVLDTTVGYCCSFLKYTAHRLFIPARENAEN